jgi:hypothetical protein
MVIINSNNIRIEREGSIDTFKGKSAAKDFRSWLVSRKSLASKRDNLELVFILNEIERAYNHYHKKKVSQVEVDGWHGKSSFEIIKDIDKLIIIKYQKPTKESEPVEVRTIIHKDEIMAVIDSIKELGGSGDEVKTRDLAKLFCMKMNYTEILNGEFWKNFFSNRKLHNRFTLLLGALDKLELIKYSGGKTKLLDKDLSIQLVL